MRTVGFESIQVSSYVGVVIYFAIALCSASVHSSSSVIDEGYVFYAQSICEKGAVEFEECMGVEGNECIDMVVSVMQQCDGEYDSASSLTRREQHSLCVERGYLSVLESKGIDPDAECGY